MNIRTSAGRQSVLHTGPLCSLDLNPRTFSSSISACLWLTKETYSIVLVELGTKPPVEENAEAKKEMEA